MLGKMRTWNGLCYFKAAALILTPCESDIVWSMEYDVRGETLFVYLSGDAEFWMGHVKLGRLVVFWAGLELYLGDWSVFVCLSGLSAMIKSMYILLKRYY